MHSLNNKYRRICITGSKGQLGSHFMRILEGRAELLGLDLPERDITDFAAMRRLLREWKPEIIYHCAAYTAVDKAESEPEKAFLINALATRVLAQICDEIKAEIIYFSTDYIFYGTPGRNPRREYDIPAPFGVYAVSKYQGEEEVKTYNKKHYIIRTSWLYGPTGNNFVRAILKAAITKPFLQVVNDQIGSPTHVSVLVEQTIRLTDGGIYGIYNVSGCGSCSWYDFAMKILELAGIDKKVYPISTQEYNAAAPRPAYSVLDHFALRNTIGDYIPDWEETLREHIRDFL